MQKRQLNIDKFSGITGSGNIIYLPDKTTFNWKSQDGVVRVNCKEHAKTVIECQTNLRLFSNGAGDRTRPFSLLIDNQEDLDLIIEALKSIDGN